MEKEISENKEKDQVKSEKENSKNDENNSSNNQENLEDNKKELTPEEEIDNLKDKLARTFAESSDSIDFSKYVVICISSPLPIAPSSGTPATSVANLIHLVQ